MTEPFTRLYAVALIRASNKTPRRQYFASSCAVENGPMRMRLDALGVSGLGLHASALHECARIFNDDTPEGSRAGGTICA